MRRNIFKFNRKNGLTLIIIAATIIVAVILISAITISYNSIINSTSKKEFAKELFLVQNQVDNYYFRNNKLPVYESNIEVEITDVNMQTQFLGETITDSKVILKEIDLIKADIEDLKRGQRKNGQFDVYAVSESTKKVYYLEGYILDSKKYYTLTDVLQKELDINTLK
ncbi:MAG: hypothetical protein N2749_06955 [Clostridia bacterium]|nr:hypothetical protein [Clostridia bacterium]